MITEYGFGAVACWFRPFLSDPELELVKVGAVARIGSQSHVLRILGNRAGADFLNSKSRSQNLTGSETLKATIPSVEKIIVQAYEGKYFLHHFVKGVLYPPC